LGEIVYVPVKGAFKVNVPKSFWSKMPVRFPLAKEIWPVAVALVICPEPASAPRITVPFKDAAVNPNPEKPSSDASHPQVPD
jgi:hypothetical protein